MIKNDVIRAYDNSIKRMNILSNNDSGRGSVSSDSSVRDTSVIGDDEKWTLFTLSMFDKAIELDINYGPAYNNKGQLLEKIGRNRQAEECYRMALHLNNNTHYKAHNNLAQVCV